MNCRTLLGVIALYLLPAALASQDSVPLGLQRLRSGHHVRLLTVEGGRLEGSLDRLTSEPPALQLRTLNPPALVSTIDSLWVRRSRAGKGAWIGALVLGVPSAIFWTGVCGAVSDNQGCDALGVVAGLTLAGAAVGAGLGALIGSTSTRWELRYVRSPSSFHGSRLRKPQLHLGLKVGLP